MTKIEMIETKDLILDEMNPRFGLSEKTGQDQAFRYLFETSDLKELWGSIVENGFLSYEPLVALKPKIAGEKYVIIEGNRRLAAAKSLLDNKLISDISPSTKVPLVPPKYVSTLKKLPVIVVTTREEADSYIGFRHVNGALTWGPLAKARFALRLFEGANDANKSSKEIIASVARKIGEQPSNLVRNLFAFKAIQQAQRLGFLEDSFLEKKNNDFSHLYTMLSNPETREFIGLGRNAIKAAQILDDPIPTAYTADFKNLIKWLYGTEDVDPLIRRQGTDRPILQRVIASERALDHLKTTGDFEAARKITGMDLEAWLNKAYSVVTTLSSILSTCDDYSDEMTDDQKSKVIFKLESAEKKMKSIIKVLK